MRILVKRGEILVPFFSILVLLSYLCTRNQIVTGMIKSMTINIGYQAKKDNAGGNGLIGNINVQTPCGQGV
jgi:hypothetical protein